MVFDCDVVLILTGMLVKMAGGGVFSAVSPADGLPPLAVSWTSALGLASC